MDFKMKSSKSGFRFGQHLIQSAADNKDSTEDTQEGLSSGGSTMSKDGKEELKFFSVEQFNEASKDKKKREFRIWRCFTHHVDVPLEKRNLVSGVGISVTYCPEARVLLLGPSGAGKSSFISSVQSVFSGRVLNRAMVGSSTSTGFTKKLQSFSIRHSCDTKLSSTGLVLCDIMGIGGEETTGLTLHDVLYTIKGHVPEGHQFSPEEPVSSKTAGFITKPSLKEKIHCVVFVIDASMINSYTKVVSRTFQQLREHISNLGVHQVMLLTHVDEVCHNTAQDVTQVYKSRIVQQLMVKAGTLLGMATSYIVPVKNYSSQLDIDENTDILLLRAVDHILQYADLYFQDGAAENKVSI